MLRHHLYHYAAASGAKLSDTRSVYRIWKVERIYFWGVGADRMITTSFYVWRRGGKVQVPAQTSGGLCGEDRLLARVEC